ncbi:MAG: hypothetical protein J6N55_08955 [Anaerovibrio sp.]|uniref:hypothetical protein n=1 Tax=Anaerovibrio sp. TaxID=1872532 RepID=UPI001B1E273A|nr:hypothetical protein [Anaerovibrio sp.]MBO6246392.1 hypothetical protein [Anaerovibrio sp.]
MSKDDAGFVIMDVILLTVLLLSLLGMIKYSFLAYDDAVNMEHRFMEELAFREYLDRLEMEADR